MKREEIRQKFIEFREKIVLAGNYSDFEQYMATKYGNTSGLTKGNLSKIISALDKDIDEKSQSRFLSKLNVFETYAEEFVEVQSGSTARYIGTQYSIYFFYRKTQTSSAERSVMLGKACLFLEKNGLAKIKNVRDGGESKDYFGTYIVGDHDLLICRLQCDMRGRDLTLKAMVSSSPPEVCYGSTLSFEGGQLTNNIVVLHKYQQDHLLPFEPALLFYGKEDFYKVPLAIRKFLSQRNLSMLKTPPRMSDLEAMQNFTKSYKSAKRNLTFSPDKPVLLIATPRGQLKTKESKQRFLNKCNAINEIIDNLTEKLKRLDIDIDFQFTDRIKDNSEYKINELYVDDIAKTFEDLKYTRYFVLIFDHGNHPSRALIELGAALQTCTAVMVLYEEKSGFPSTVEALEFRPAYQPLTIKDFRGKVDDEVAKDRITKSIFNMIARLH